jgi:methionyl-tRNA synthetase
MVSSLAPGSQFAVTTPLYYVNDLPHVGSAYTTIAADVMARFQRLRGIPTLLITGTDEHGQKIQRTAEALGRSPQAHCDEIVTHFSALWDRLGIHPDRFIRTTDPRHEALVKEFFQRVWDQGDIYLGQQTGWYCVACEEFKEERDLLGDRPTHPAADAPGADSGTAHGQGPGSGDRFCPIHTNKAVEWRDEQNYFFRLSHYQAKLEAFYDAHPDFIQPEIRRNEVLSFVAQGLQDFSISRVNLDWGIPVPADAKHTLYVWFDALLGYVTALLEPDDEPTLERALAHWWPINLHLIGKDILRFHAVYWPAMLLSAGLPLPDRVFGHGFLTKDGQKMGKSLGNVLDPVDLVQRFGSDAVRYYFLKEIEFGRDGDFNETRFINILNADLANDLGNLLNRTLKMVLKYCGATVPNPFVSSPLAPSSLAQNSSGLGPGQKGAGDSRAQASISPESTAPSELSAPGSAPPASSVQTAQTIDLAQLGQGLGDRVAGFYEALAFSAACDAILSLARAGNKFIDEQAPWTLYKHGHHQQVEGILYTALEAVRLSAYLLSPITPNLSSAIYQQLGFDWTFTELASDRPASGAVPLFDNHATWGQLPPGQPLGEPKPVFQRLESAAAPSGSG